MKTALCLFSSRRRERKNVLMGTYVLNLNDMLSNADKNWTFDPLSKITFPNRSLSTRPSHSLHPIFKKKSQNNKILPNKIVREKTKYRFGKQMMVHRLTYDVWISHFLCKKKEGTLFFRVKFSIELISDNPKI